MSWLDLLLGLSLALCTIRGIRRGFFHEVAGCVALVAGMFIAISTCKPIGLFLSQHVGLSLPLAAILGFLLPLIGIIIITYLIAAILLRIVKMLSMSWLNKLAGGGIALLKNLILLSILLNIYEIVDSDRSLIGPERVEQSQLYTPVLNAVPALFPPFPDVSLQLESEDSTEPKLVV